MSNLCCAHIASRYKSESTQVRVYAETPCGLVMMCRMCAGVDIHIRKYFLYLGELSLIFPFKPTALPMDVAL